jgi:hypothetical protein
VHAEKVRTEGVKGVQDFIYVRFVEIHKSRNITSRVWRVIYFIPCLIERDLSRRRAGFINWVRYPPEPVIPVILTSSTFPSTARALRQLVTGNPITVKSRDTHLVQQPNSKANIHLHLFFLRLSCHPVVHDNIGRILPAAISIRTKQ